MVLRSYCEADLHLCFCIAKIRFSHGAAHMFSAYSICMSVIVLDDVRKMATTLGKSYSSLLSIFLRKSNCLEVLSFPWDFKFNQFLYLLFLLAIKDIEEWGRII